MGWNPFRKPASQADETAEIAEAERRQEVYRLAREAERYAERLLAKVSVLREELNHGA